MAERLRERATERGVAVAVVGPAPAYIARRADRWRWNVVLRGADPVALLDGGRRRPVVGRRRPGVVALSRDLRQVTGSPVRATMWRHQTEEPNAMTDPLNPPTPNEPTPDETFTWTGDGGSGAGDPADHAHASGDAGSTGQAGATGAAAGATATAILESLREAVDDLAERATPTVREFSARAAELAADRRRPGRTDRPAGRRGDLRCERQARHEVAHLGRGPARVDRRGRRAGAATPRRRPRPPPPAAGTRPAPDADPATSTARTPPDRARYTPAMSVRPIVLLGDPRLRLKGKPVDSFGKYLHELLDDLAHTMRDAPGCRAGRAAAR